METFLKSLRRTGCVSVVVPEIFERGREIFTVFPSLPSIVRTRGKHKLEMAPHVLHGEIIARRTFYKGEEIDTRAQIEAVGPSISRLMRNLGLRPSKYLLMMHGMRYDQSEVCTWTETAFSGTFRLIHIDNLNKKQAPSHARSVVIDVTL